MTAVTLSSHCGLNLREWPYDEQECMVNLGIKEYKITEAEFVESKLLFDLNKLSFFICLLLNYQILLLPPTRRQ